MDSGFGEIPPGTVFDKDKTSSFSMDFLESAVSAKEANETLESVGQMGFTVPEEEVSNLPDAATLKSMVDFVEGKTDTPPPIPGQTLPMGLPHQAQAPVPVAPQPPNTPSPEALAQGGIQEDAVSPPASGSQDFSAAIRPLIESQQQQMQMLMQQQQQQAYMQQQLLDQLVSNQRQYIDANSDQLRMQQIQRAGLDPTDPTQVQIFNMYEREQALTQQVQRLQQNLDYIQQHAASISTESQMTDAIESELASTFPDRDVPKETIRSAARVASALASTHGGDAAVRTALEGILPLVRQLPSKTAAKARPQQRAQAPQQQPQLPSQQMHPGLEAMAQLPQFAGLSPQQLAGVFQTMNASSLAGAGAGRHQSRSLPTIEDVDAMLWQ